MKKQSHYPLWGGAIAVYRGIGWLLSGVDDDAAELLEDEAVGVFE